jgi:hypothetical protein
VLRDSFAVYLDVLGTRQAMASMDDKALRQQIELLDALASDLHDPGWEDFFQRMVSFSDNIALSVPMRDDSGTLLGVGYLMQPVAVFQLGMALSGRFVRGGIAAGRLYSDYTHVTGPALVKAVELEEDVAVFPRVLLDEDTVMLALLDTRGYGEPYKSPWNSQLLADADGRVFVNYLSATEEVARPAARSLIGRHRTQVLRALTTYHEPSRIRQKYVWAAHYHNAFCRYWYPRAPRLLVSDGLTPLEERYPRQFQLLLESER